MKYQLIPPMVSLKKSKRNWLRPSGSVKSRLMRAASARVTTTRMPILLNHRRIDWRATPMW